MKEDHMHMESAPELTVVCDELIVRMGHDPSTAPRSRVAVDFHQVPSLFLSLSLALSLNSPSLPPPLHV